MSSRPIYRQLWPRVDDATYVQRAGVMSTIGDTFRYMSPEYVYNKSTNEKVDVYNFDVMLLELRFPSISRRPRR
uniref:Protein kinase domain-containing protein n=1 Tax=Leersia perrieri TaxID=77586 RepID=A0A0D9X5N2_9ORYZ